MHWIRTVLGLWLLLCTTAPALAQQVKEKALPLNGAWNSAGTVLTLDWQDARPLRVGPVEVKRRLFGQTGGATWTPLAQDIRIRTFHEDLTPARGTAYEYQIIRRARDIVDVGYWLAGWEVPTRPERGVALLIVEEGLQDSLGPRIDRFERDLIGDGWRVIRHSAPRHDAKAPVETLAAARSLRAWITNAAEQDRTAPHSLILLGHLPVVFSGLVAPDGHMREPHATDLFYADIGRRWADGGDGVLRPSTLPDLKIDMTVGRIDFESVARKDLSEERRMLARYLDRNHHWRHARLRVGQTAYGTDARLTVEQAALRNIVGPDAITQGGHDDIGPTAPFLWGVDFGPRKPELYAGAEMKPVFAINFGSHKQKFTKAGNAMIALLAQDWYPLAVGWGGRPSWQIQLMSLGGTIGDAHLRTVNNGPLSGGPYRDVLDYYPMGQYLWRGPIWVNLMGDPTLHAFPLAPPKRMTATRTGQSVALAWQMPQAADVLGAQVFRAASQADPFVPVSGLLTTPEFTDPGAPEGAIYMVRSYGLKLVHAGSFFTYSQGVFAAPEDAGPLPTPVLQTLSTAPGMPVAISAPSDGIWSFLEGPQVGPLRQDADGWTYTPPEGFTGTVVLRNAISTAYGTQDGTTTIRVAP